MSIDDLTVLPVETRKDLKAFLRLPYSLYRNDPHWIAPLWRERWEILHPQKNPFYEHAKVRLFLARRNGKTVGRLSAQIDREYEEFHKERIGNFGFFECENRLETARALFTAAEAFLKENGITRSLGPFSFSINEESGLLVEGFDQPLMTMMPYNPPYYASLIEALGYRKAKDLYAWRYEVGEIPKDPLDVAKMVSETPHLTIRTIDMKRFREDLDKIMEIFNSAWSENWGFVPFTSKELDKMARDLKTFVDPRGIILAEIKGEPAAMLVMIPNLYEMIHDLKGRLFPFGIFKLLWRIRRRSYRSGRLLLLGVKKEYRGTVLGGLSILLYVEAQKRGLEAGAQWGELSWTLEDNRAINTGIEFMGGKIYKRYRIYEKCL